MNTFNISERSAQPTVMSTKNENFLKYRIFLRNDSILMKFLVEIRTDYKFCLYIFSSP
eukprot:UN21856